MWMWLTDPEKSNDCTINVSSSPSVSNLIHSEYITSPYCVSKIGVNRLTQLQVKALASDPTRPGILVNAIS